uniref:phosphoribosylglycinamide formyltransferase 1 n=1 Tax=Oryza nivara TaxID=4536 RepID=A0A0E0HQ65_ORYNI
MEVAITSTTSSLRCSPNPTLISRGALERWGSLSPKPQSRGVRCKQLIHRVSRVYAVARTKGGDAGSVGIEERGKKKNRLTMFVSSGGSNFRAIHSRSARREPKGLSTNELLNTLRELKVDSILLASYSKLIPVELVQAYPRSIWNIHPSLLPAFGGKGYYGLKVHKAVVASRARYSGPTVHFVDEHYDIGRTLAQRVVSMLANDTLEQLATREHQVYVDVVTALCDDRIVWREDGVPIIRSRTNPDEYT